MKKILTLIVVITLSSAISVLADDKKEYIQIDSRQENHMGDNIKNYNGNNPYVSAGTSGGFVQNWAPRQENTNQFLLTIASQFNGLTLSDITRIAKEGPVDTEIISVLPPYSGPISILMVTPTDKFLIGTSTTKAQPDENPLHAMARAIAAICTQTNAHYVLVRANWKQRSGTYGNSDGLGAASNIGTKGAASTGGLYGYTINEYVTVPNFVVEAYGGKKFPKKEKREVKKPPKIRKKVEKKDMSLKFDGEPIYFAFNKDTPLPGQEKKVLEWTNFIAQNFRTIHNGIHIEGHCDERGGEGYNAGLGLRRAQVIKKMIIEKATFNQDPKNIPKIKTVLDASIKVLSAGKGDLLPRNLGNQPNRRCDLVVGDINLTKDNIKGEKK